MLEETVPQAYWKVRHVHVSLASSSLVSLLLTQISVCVWGWEIF